jgi:hypothetical protein
VPRRAAGAPAPLGSLPARAPLPHLHANALVRGGFGGEGLPATGPNAPPLPFGGGAELAGGAVAAAAAARRLLLEHAAAARKEVAQLATPAAARPAATVAPVLGAGAGHARLPRGWGGAAGALTAGGEGGGEAAEREQEQGQGLGPCGVAGGYGGSDYGAVEGEGRGGEGPSEEARALGVEPVLTARREEVAGGRSADVEWVGGGGGGGGGGDDDDDSAVSAAASEGGGLGVVEGMDAEESARRLQAWAAAREGEDEEGLGHAGCRQL